MNLIEQTIQATIDSAGQLQLPHQPSLPPGPVLVTIRSAAPVSPKRTLVDVIQEISDAQRARGFSGRSHEELEAEGEARRAEDDERDQMLKAARGEPSQE